MLEAKDTMTAEQFAEFGRRLARNPALRSLRVAGGGDV
jgi:hypothetical protein